MEDIEGLAKKRYCSLKEKIEKNPMTISDFLNIIKNDIISIHSAGISADGWLIPWQNKYKMVLNSNRSPKVKKKTIIHESSHVYYDLVDNYPVKTTEEEEDLLDKEDERFYNQHKHFIDKYYRHLKNKWAF